MVVVVGRCLERCEHYEDFCSTRHVEIDVNNKHLIVASCWFLFLQILLTMHGHRNLNIVINEHIFSLKVRVTFSDSNQFLIFSTVFRKKISKYQMNENPSSGSRVVPCGWTDITNLTVVFLKFAMAPDGQCS